MRDAPPRGGPAATESGIRGLGHHAPQRYRPAIGVAIRRSFVVRQQAARRRTLSLRHDRRAVRCRQATEPVSRPWCVASPALQCGDRARPTSFATSAGHSSFRVHRQAAGPAAPTRSIRCCPVGASCGSACGGHDEFQHCQFVGQVSCARGGPFGGGIGIQSDRRGRSAPCRRCADMPLKGGSDLSRNEIDAFAGRLWPRALGKAAVSPKAPAAPDGARRRNVSHRGRLESTSAARERVPRRSQARRRRRRCPCELDFAPPRRRSGCRRRRLSPPRPAHQSPPRGRRRAKPPRPAIRTSPAPRARPASSADPGSPNRDAVRGGVETPAPLSLSGIGFEPGVQPQKRCSASQNARAVSAAQRVA